MTSKILNPKDIAETLTMLGKGTALLQLKIFPSRVMHKDFLNDKRDN